MRFVTNTFRYIRVRPRLSAATAIGIVLIAFLPKTIAGPTRALLAWDLGAGLYLGLAWTMMFRASVEKMRWRARIQDDGAEVILALTVVAAVASLAAILLELIGIKGLSPRLQTLHLGLAALTILLSWSFVHTAFALHYAHEFYDDAGKERRRCLDFPGNSEPDYVDFLYFAFVLGTTSQTSDVTINSSPMRRLALLHGVIAFFFNTTLLALMVNIAAGLT
jgi:uncharacterized membrane protein